MKMMVLRHDAAFFDLPVGHGTIIAMNHPGKKAGNNFFLGDTNNLNQWFVFFSMAP